MSCSVAAVGLLRVYKNDAVDLAHLSEVPVKSARIACFSYDRRRFESSIQPPKVASDHTMPAQEILAMRYIVCVCMCI